MRPEILFTLLVLILKLWHCLIYLFNYDLVLSDSTLRQSWKLYRVMLRLQLPLGCRLRTIGLLHGHQHRFRWGSFTQRLFQIAVRLSFENDRLLLQVKGGESRHAVVPIAPIPENNFTCPCYYAL